MVHISIIEAKLSKTGVKISRWFRPEIKELEKILMDGEDIVLVVPGRYFGGYAMLVATDRRLLMIDKRTFFMNLEDIRFDMISEVDFSSRLLDSTITIFTLNKQHRFSSTKYKSHLRQLTAYVQQQVSQLRQQQYHPQQTPEPEHHFNLTSHLHRPAFLRSPHTHKLVGATAMLAARRSAVGYPRTSFTTHTQAGFNSGFLSVVTPD
ncbi:MAG TPA: PH domain-containing protein [Candidatus Saccharimonadales bacterium]|nr:PH domain-containing protein [Candidatus Saccharimonadales bacterium]